MSYRIGVYVGGTFTDVLLIDEKNSAPLPPQARQVQLLRCLRSLRPILPLPFGRRFGAPVSDRLAGTVNRRAATQASRTGLGVALISCVRMSSFSDAFSLEAVVSRTVQTHPTARIQPPTTSVGQCTPR
jgi:hypothetical protein